MKSNRIRTTMGVLLLASILPGWAGPVESDPNGAPPLPPGLGAPEEPEEPALPPGLGEDDEGDDESKSEKKKLLDRLPAGLRGFAEVSIGPRIYDDPAHSKEFTLAEMRFQVAYDRAWKHVSFDGKGDLILDAVLEEVNTDLRQLRVTFRPADAVDIQVGRQVMTWGTGDLLFINDLFPKDWPSFFIGQEEEYLKAPSNAVRFGLFTSTINANLVYTPRFTPDRFIRGERISFWDPERGGFRGDDMPVNAEVPDERFTDDEIALRLYGNAGSYEIAGYGYSGFWKSPSGFDPTLMKATFPELDVWGASLRGPVGPGIGNIEVGWYDSREDPDGSDPYVRNSEFRLLVGYELELGKELTGGFQYYLEHMIDYDAYLGSLPGGEPRDENRHVVTTRLTKMFRSQTLIPSIFVYYSPSDRDGYARPKLVWKRSDHLVFEFGANLFFGKDDSTFFGQFENNSNVYGAIRFQT